MTPAGCTGIDCIVALPMDAAAAVAGAVVISTKEKKHWLSVDYKDIGGAREFVVQLDKSEYQRIITAIKAQSGKDVEIIPDEVNDSARIRRRPGN